MTYDTINEARTVAGNAEGTLLANRYRVVRQLGQGGMGSVWLAEDTQLDNRQFAIKMLPSILVSNKRAYRQLKDEALVAMQLVHPNIVQIRAFEENDGNPFLVMDYVDGQTLDDYLAEHTGTTGVSPVGHGLPEAEVLRILRPIAAALDYAHSKGVVHRDIKPGNVMVAKDGTPYILDFGIAREIQETITHVTGKLSSGTLLYMSPEQLMGVPPKPAQDIYSFAAMAYECLKGEPPFVHGSIEDQIKNKQPAPLVAPTGNAAILAAGIMAGLAKKPESRPASCTAVLGGRASPRAETGGRASPRAAAGESRSGTGVKGILAVTALVLMAVAGGWLWMGGREKAEKPSLPQNGECREFTLPGGVKMEMVYVEPGSFTMGSSSGDKEETPPHQVRITKPYWIGKYPVTQSQWKALASSNGVSFSERAPIPYYSRDGGGKGRVSGMDTSDFPMECITWKDCDALVKALNRNRGATDEHVYSLPTEAQWEFAAKGGTKSLGYTYSGGNDMDKLGWYYENSGVQKLSDSDRKIDKMKSNKCQPHSVKEKDVGNELGIVGMSGNVWEWCNDWYGKDYYSKSPTNDPQGPASGDDRVLRGGSWGSSAWRCRPAYRRWERPGIHCSNFGFRLCCSAGPCE